MFRTLILLAALILLFLILKNRFSMRKAKSDSHDTDGRDTVRCLQCGVYIPKTDATVSSGRSFCSDEHRERWDDDHG